VTERRCDEGSSLRIFFATDIHGSEKCFMKFVNAGAFYRVDALIMGGDLTGKAIVPLVAHGGGRYACSLLGRAHEADGPAELEALEKLVRVNGFYPFRTDPHEVAALAADEELRERKFLELMRTSVERWVSIAEERLRGTRIACFMTPGNDDHLAIDDVLEGSDVVVNPEGRLLEVGDHELVSCGWSGPTPFDTPRECSEEELGRKIEALASQLRSPETAIFNLHNPPYASKLDLAPLLDADLRVQSEGGQPRMVPVGSVAVRSAIEIYRPQLGLHGHIHESRAQAKLNGTVCINPGSEYSEGVLRGALVELKRNKVKNVQLVSG
jgi:uncharacterized protein